MKSKYIRPRMTVIYVAQTLLQSMSNTAPKVGVDRNLSIGASSIEVKSSVSYDVWEDDWSE